MQTCPHPALQLRNKLKFIHTIVARRLQNLDWSITHSQGTVLNCMSPYFWSCVGGGRCRALSWLRFRLAVMMAASQLCSRIIKLAKGYLANRWAFSVYAWGHIDMQFAPWVGNMAASLRRFDNHVQHIQYNDNVAAMVDQHTWVLGSQPLSVGQHLVSVFQMI